MKYALLFALNWTSFTAMAQNVPNHFNCADELLPLAQSYVKPDPESVRVAMVQIHKYEVLLTQIQSNLTAGYSNRNNFRMIQQGLHSLEQDSVEGILLVHCLRPVVQISGTQAEQKSMTKFALKQLSFLKKEIQQKI